MFSLTFCILAFALIGMIAWALGGILANAIGDIDIFTSEEE